MNVKLIFQIYNFTLERFFRSRIHAKSIIFSLKNDYFQRINQFKSIKTTILFTSLVNERFKWYRCKSDKPLLK